MNELEDLALKRVTCPRCEARPQEDCRTVTGEPAGRMHIARVGPLYTAYDIGLQERLTREDITP